MADARMEIKNVNFKIEKRRVDMKCKFGLVIFKQQTAVQGRTRPSQHNDNDARGAIWAKAIKHFLHPEIVLLSQLGLQFLRAQQLGLPV